MLALAGLVAASTAAVPAVASVQDDGAGVTPGPQQAVVVDDLDDLPEGIDLEDLDEGDVEFEEPTAEELAVVSNLVTNAVAYTGRRGEIAVTTGTDGSEIVITVADTSSAWGRPLRCGFPGETLI